MLLFDLIAEQRIAEAIACGELENLPGAGRLLDLDDDSLIPADLRMAYRILKNAGFVPPEVEALRELSELERFIGTPTEDEARNASWRKLQLLRTRIEASGMRRHGLQGGGRYTQRVLARLANSTASDISPRK